MFQYVVANSESQSLSRTILEIPNHYLSYQWDTNRSPSLVISFLMNTIPNNGEVETSYKGL